MTTCILARAFFRVWGVVIILQSLMTIPAQAIVALAASRQPDAMARPVYVAGLGGTVLTLMIGVLLVTHAGNLAARLFPHEERLRFSLGVDHLVPLMFTVVGLWFAIAGAGGLAATADVVLRQPEWILDSPAAYMWEQHRQEFIRSVAELVCGAVLVLGRRGLTRLWMHLRPMSEPAA
jgi:hypothetical protein